MTFDRALLNRVVLNISGPQHRWTAGLTSMLRLDANERRRRLGYAPGPAEPTLQAREAEAVRLLAAPGPARAALPSSVDWRSKDGRNWVTPVKDQGRCGSCVAFSTIGALEAAARIKKNLAVNDVGGGTMLPLSEAQLYYCSTAASAHDCSSGWWVDSALDYCRGTGLAPSSDFPYVAGDRACNLAAGWQQRVTKLREAQALLSSSSMKDWIANKGPVISCFSVYDDFYAYSGGVYTKGNNATLEGGHSVCVVGYDDAQKAWICKNSWGTGWGQGGYFMIKYGECGIDAKMWAPAAFASIYQIPTEAEGTLLRQADGKIWVIYGGAKFHVPDMATLSALFPGVPITQVDDRVINDIPDSPVDGTLLRETNGAIWVVYRGAKFHVPDPATLGALFAGQPIHQLWDGALDRIGVVPSSETLLREANGAISLVYRGAKFRVPDPATLSRLTAGLPMFQLWDGAFSNIPAAPIDSTLLREDDGTIWMVYGGAKFHVPNMDVFERHYGGAVMRQVWNRALDNIQTTPRDGTLLREDNGAIWVIFGGAKFHVPDPDTYLRLFGRGSLGQVWDGALNTIGTVPVDGTLLREESSATVFVMAGGRKSQVVGVPNGSVRVVWDGALAQLP